MGVNHDELFSRYGYSTNSNWFRSLVSAVDGYHQRGNYISKDNLDKTVVSLTQAENVHGLECVHIVSQIRVSHFILGIMRGFSDSTREIILQHFVTHSRRSRFMFDFHDLSLHWPTSQLLVKSHCDQHERSP